MKYNPFRETAERMIKRYGIGKAQEYAYGYAVGAYFQQTEVGRADWFRVLEELEKLERELKGKPRCQGASPHER